MWNKIKDIISQYLEISETRKSTVLLILLLFSAIGLYKAYIGTDIPPLICNVILTLSGYIFGINAVNSVSGMYSSYQSNNSNYNNISATINPNSTINNNDINGSV